MRDLAPRTDCSRTGARRFRAHPVAAGRRESQASEIRMKKYDGRNVCRAFPGPASPSPFAPDTSSFLFTDTYAEHSAKNIPNAAGRGGGMSQVGPEIEEGPNPKAERLEGRKVIKPVLRDLSAFQSLPAFQAFSLQFHRQLEVRY